MAADPIQNNQSATNAPVMSNDLNTKATSVKEEELPNPLDDATKANLPDFSQVSDKNQLDQDVVAKEPDLTTEEKLPEELKLSSENEAGQPQGSEMMQPTVSPPTTTEPAVSDQTQPDQPVAASANPQINQSMSQPIPNPDLANAFGVGQPQTAALSSQIPDEIKGWNWGAFFLSWIWAIGNQVWIGLLAILGPLWLPMIIILGVKGNEWAWQARKFASVEDFRKTQSAWVKWGIVLFALQVIIIILVVSAVVSAYRSNSTTTTSTPTYQYQY